MKYMNEMFIALLLVTGLTAFVKADTVINYDDGSTYTVPAGDKVYVTGEKLFKKKQWPNGGVNFSVVHSNSKRDFVPTEPVGAPEGSHEWCKEYVPWSEGLSFGMITWQRSCDTNNDNQYGCGDVQFDASEDGNVCPS